VHGEKLGVICLFTADSGRRYTREDVPMAEELAARAALAVHSARLHKTVLESAERLRISAAAAGLGIFEWNLESGAIVWENPRIYEIFGRSQERGPLQEPEFFGEVLHPEDRERVKAGIGNAARLGTSFQSTFRIFRADGELRVIELAGRCDPTDSAADGCSGWWPISPNESSWRTGFWNPPNWRASACWRAASRTISTTC